VRANPRHAAARTVLARVRMAIDLEALESAQAGQLTDLDRIVDAPYRRGPTAA